jgi:serine/threonine protein kinase
MGQVYLARSAAGRLVAIKTIKPELAEEEGFRTRFAQEVVAARRVGGFFTAAVVEADPDADLPWLATAYVPAPSLRRMVQVCGPLPPAAVRWLAAGCAEALESIHAVGLVHLDLKPSNVLVAADGPRVIDFGVARAAGRIGLAPWHGPVGTPAYMAPEQARDVRQASPASDVFALGATLLFAATGHPPYSGETTADVLFRLANELPDLTGLPAELTGLIAACLDRDPRRRPSSAAVLARLGQFTEDVCYLPADAISLIGQYQPGRVADTDDTAPSVPELPDKARPGNPPLDSWPALRSWPVLRWAVPRSRRGSPAPRTWRGRMRPPAWFGWSAGGAILVASGVILGATLTSSGASTTPPAASGAAAHTSTGPTTGLGPAATGPGPNAPSLAQLLPMTGPRCGTKIKTHPALCVNKRYGYPGDTFSVTVLGLKAHTRVSLTVLLIPPPQSASLQPTLIRAFTMTANGTRSLGPLWGLGRYEIETAPSGGIHAVFVIIPSAGQQP